jgi:NAD(P)-dependent dehydrogenase (short-subunit alcohol dehydrogenase family)
MSKLAIEDEESVMRFEGRVVLITGGGTGIGRAAAELFITEGARVVVTGRRAEPLRALEDAHSDKVATVVGDIAADDGPSKAVQCAVDRFGGLDVLVNNASLWITKSVRDLSDDDIFQSLSVNQAAILRMVREALPHLLARRGTIVNLSSTGAQRPMADNALYAGSKAAVESMTRCLAVELGPAGIRVNSVAPGATDTEMLADSLTDEVRELTASLTPLGRVGTAEDVARAVVWLASPEADWITGQVVQSSGGIML